MQSCWLPPDLALASVVTLPEACKRWQRNRKTILMAMWLGDLAYVQQGKIYLISVASLYQRWGAPLQKTGHK